MHCEISVLFLNTIMPEGLLDPAENLRNLKFKHFKWLGYQAEANSYDKCMEYSVCKCMNTEYHFVFLLQSIYSKGWYYKDVIRTTPNR